MAGVITIAKRRWKKRMCSASSVIFLKSVTERLYGALRWNIGASNAKHAKSAFGNRHDVRTACLLHRLASFDACYHGPSRCEDARYDIGTDSSLEVEGGGGLVDGKTPYLPYVF